VGGGGGAGKRVRGRAGVGGGEEGVVGEGGGWEGGGNSEGTQIMELLSHVWKRRVNRTSSIFHGRLASLEGFAKSALITSGRSPYEKGAEAMSCDSYCKEGR